VSPLFNKHQFSCLGSVVACLPHLNSNKMRDDVLGDVLHLDEMPEDLYLDVR